MSESVDSRKLDRKPVFDVPLPMRRARDAPSSEHGDGAASSPLNTIKFSLLSKRGNKQQTRSIDVPTDSTFAVAMRSKQQAEKEEQQRIKNLVLNYDLRDDDADGDCTLSSPLTANLNRRNAEAREGLEKHNAYSQPRLDKAGTNRSHQRSRKLQLSDVEW